MDFPIYRYSALENPLQDIRLATILPGGYGDDPRIRIDHVALDITACLASSKPPLADIRKSLPLGWDVCETVNGRRLFSRATEEGGLETRWTHPISNERPVCEQITKASTGPSFDALSYVWGDREGPDSKHALVECFESLEMPMWENRVLPSPGSMTNWYRRDFPMPLSSKEWESILSLCKLPWFRRVWVVQEALLGRTNTILRSGQTDISWNVFGCALSAITRNDHVSDEVRGAMVRILDLCLFRHDDAPTKRALVLAARRFCADPRDRVYGLLGILPAALRRKVQPNYNDAPQKVLSDCALACIDHVQRLEVLDLCATVRPLTKDGPSWAFDPCDEKRRQGWYVTMGLWAGQFSAHYSESVAESTAPGVLSVLGLQVTKVLTTTPRAPAWWDSPSGEVDYRSCIQAVRDWEPANLYRETYVTGESLLTAYARTLAFDMVSDRMQSKDYFPSLENWQEQDTKNALFGDNAKKGEFALPGMPVKERTTITRLFGMRFMTSDNGFIGLCPTV